MLKFYYHPSPNPAKVALFLEEAAIPYEMIPVDTRKGEQFKPEFLAINPNAKTPAIDDDGVVVFDSNAILMYLAEKSGKFMPANTPAARGQMLSWLMFVATGIGPYSGQAVHFRNFAPKFDYAINRYMYEAKRHWEILDAHLEHSRYMVGDTYTFVDMAVWGWARVAPFVLGNENAWQQMPNLKRLYDEISSRPAASRANALKDKHEFKTEMDDAARRNLFPQNV